MKTESERNTATNKQETLVVGLGSSAGGLQALLSFFEEIPANSGMAFVVIQHMASDLTSMLVELLAKKVRIPVHEALFNMPVQPDNVYVITPGSRLGIANNELQVLDEKNAPIHLNIDYFLTALAKDQGEQSVGVILSGSGSDGARGIKAISDEGGITMAQSEDSAAYGFMPHNAIAEGCIDYVLPPKEMARQLVKIAKQGHSHREQAEDSPASNRNLNTIFSLLKHHAGHDFSHYKNTTMQRRIRRRMVLNHIPSLKEYIAFLKSNRPELDKLFDDLLINVTCFFRDPEMFAALKLLAFPALIANRSAKEPIRIWMPGCSTGEEPYSLAIVLMEFLGEQWAEHPVQIFATDIDAKVVVNARTGIYSEASMSNVSLARRNRFFNKVPGGFQIAKAIRDRCVFAEQNVLKDPPFSRIDMISCRNLLIYLDNVMQKKLLSIFHFSLRPGGMLVLGASESTSSGDEWFSAIDNKWKIYARKTSPFKPKYDFDGVATSVQKTLPKLAGEAVLTRNLQKEAEHYILYHYGPPAVIINSHLDIVGFLGETGPFIEPSPGAVSLKLLKMVHRDLVLELRTLVNAAVKDNTTTQRENAHCKIGDEEKIIHLKIIPLQGADAPEKYFMVLFENGIHSHQTTHSPLARLTSLTPTDKDERIMELERQLNSLRDEMQGIVGEHLITNEELQTANEEVQSAIEELQSTNEELESAKEELQSTNEELVTVNDELESRNTELVQLNCDLKTLFESINLPMLILNGDLKIRQFTPSIKPLLNIIDSDVGRPFSNIRPNIDVPDIDKTVLEVIEHACPRVIDAKDKSGCWYSISIHPYKTADHRIAGAVMVFFNMTDIRLDLDQPHWLTTLARDSSDAISLVGLNGKFIAWNAMAEQLYGYTEAEALRMNLLDLVPDIARKETETLLQQIREKTASFPISSMRIKKDGKIVNVLVVATGMYDQRGNLFAIALTERDFTRLNPDIEKALLLATVIEECGGAIITTSTHGEITYWNEKAQENYGYSEEEMRSMNIATLLAPNDQITFQPWLQALIDNKVPETFNAQRQTKSGELITVAGVAIIRANNLTTDVTFFEKCKQ